MGAVGWAAMWAATTTRYCGTCTPKRKSCREAAYWELLEIRNTDHAMWRGWSDVTESMVTVGSPFCGYDNTTWCVELNGKDLSCHLNKIVSVSLRKCPYDHWLASKAYLSAITVANISQSFTYKMAAKINCGIKKITSLSPYVYVEHLVWYVYLCIPGQ